jgi:hypothetical protein
MNNKSRRDFLRICGLAGLGVAATRVVPIAEPGGNERNSPRTRVPTTSCSMPRAVGTPRT